MRLTRAALRAEATSATPAHSQDSQALDASNAPLSPTKLRVPLGDIAANTAALEIVDIDQEVADKMPPKKASKAKAGAKKGKGAKKSKKGADPDVEFEEVVDAQDVVLEDERAAAGSPASDAATDELAKGPAHDAIADQMPIDDQRPASPPSRAVRMTRRQLAKQEELSRSLRAQAPPTDLEAEVDIGAEETPEEAQPVNDQVEETIEESKEEGPAASVQQIPPSKERESRPHGGIAAELEHLERESESPAQGGAQEEHPQVKQTQPGLAVIAPEVSITASDPEPKSLTSKPCEEESTPTTSRVPSRSPSKSPARSSRSPMRLEESIEAIDALEEALDNIGKAIPVFDESDDRSPKKARFPRGAPGVDSNGNSIAPPRFSRKPVGPLKSLKPVAIPPKPTRTSLARTSSLRTAPSKDPTATQPRKGSGEIVDYLASKRRPISLSFPAPPPPPKSKKAPTQPTFQLPGDAIAAKLKAAKEERLKREEGEGAKKPAFMPPPPPKSSKAPTRPTFKLSSETVAAKLKAQKEERLRREEEEAAKKKAEAFKARPVPVRKNGPVPVRQTAASKARENLMNGKSAVPESAENGLKRNGSVTASSAASSKRNSVISMSNSASSRPGFTTSLSGSNPNRMSMVNTNPVQKSTVTAADAAAQRLKAREIFNRDKLEKESREKERREKEEAAKRARAAAAERGRIASREWAEKQKLKRMSAAPVVSAGPAVAGAGGA